MAEAEEALDASKHHCSLEKQQALDEFEDETMHWRRPASSKRFCPLHRGNTMGSYRFELVAEPPV